MSSAHPDLGDLGPELRKLAQTILDGIDPAVRLAAARMSAAGVGTGKCQQVWCPVCALAALVSGEQHPMLGVIAEHSVALLAVIHAMVDGVDQSPTPPPTPPPAPPPDGPPGGRAADAGTTSRYQPIPVTVEE